MYRQKNKWTPQLNFAFTVFTKPAHNHMFEVNTKAAFLSERLHHWCKKVFIAVYGCATFATYKMVVMSFFCVVIDESVTRFALADASQLLEEL